MNTKTLNLTLTVLCATFLLCACGDLLEDDDNGGGAEGQGGGSLDFVGGDDSGASCGDYFDCASDCESEGCSEACFDELSGRAQQQLGNLYSCAEENECRDGECVQRRCASELETCIGEPLPQPEPEPVAGSYRCPDFFACAEHCETDGCYDRCFESLRAREQQVLLSLIQCNSDHGCSDSACLERNCASEINACFN